MNDIKYWINHIDNKIPNCSIEKLLDNNSIYIPGLNNFNLINSYSINLTNLIFNNKDINTSTSNTVLEYIIKTIDYINTLSQEVTESIGFTTFFKDIAFILNYRERSSPKSPQIKNYLYNIFKIFLEIVSSKKIIVSILLLDTLDEELSPIVLQIQKIFIDVYDKGIYNKLPYSNPILGILVSKEKILDDELLNYTLFNSSYHKYNYIFNELIPNSLAMSPLDYGIHKSISINFYNLAKRSKSIHNYEKLIESTFEICANIFKVHLSSIQQSAWIKLANLYSSIGVVGLVESASLFTDFSADDLIEKLILKLNRLCEVHFRKNKIKIILELLYNECIGLYLAQRDNLIFNINNYGYSNQFYPLYNESGIFNKIFSDGRFSSIFNGFGNTNLLIKEKLNPEITKKILKICYDSHVKMVTISGIYSKCDNEHITEFFTKVCPKCGLEITRYYTKNSGFLSKNLIPLNCEPKLLCQYKQNYLKL